MLLDGPRSILSPAVFFWGRGGGGSDGRSGVGSIPLVCVWGVHVVLPLSWFSNPQSQQASDRRPTP